MRKVIGTLALLLTLSIGCGAVRLTIPKPPPVELGPRYAEPMKHPQTGEWGVWEPNWSAAKGVEDMLRLQERNEKCDLIIDKLNSAR